MADEDKQELAEELAKRAGRQGKSAARNAGRAARLAAEDAGEHVADAAKDVAHKAEATVEDAANAVRAHKPRFYHRLNAQRMLETSAELSLGLVALGVSIYTGGYALHQFRKVLYGGTRVVITPPVPPAV